METTRATDRQSFRHRATLNSLGAAFFIAAVVTLFASAAGGVRVGAATEAVWTSVSCREFHTWPQLPQAEEDFGEFLGKDVAATTVSGQGTDTLTVVSSGSYPSYGVICNVTYENDGVAPSLVDSVTLAAGSGLSSCALSSSQNGGQTTKEMACAELTARFTTVLGVMLAPNGSASGTLVYHTEQQAPEAAVLSFTVDLRLTREDTPTPTPTGTPQNQVVQTPTSTAQPTETPRTSEVAGRVSDPTKTPTPVSETQGVSNLPGTGAGGIYRDGSGLGLVAGLALLFAAAVLFYLANRPRRAP
jgi:hypothetical protein